MTDFIIVVILGVICGAAVGYIYKAKKSGAKCIGCPAGGCCGSCGKGGACGCGGSTASDFCCRSENE